ncbi:hypothetical protein Q9K42_004293 [Salmonella enterica]|nr:hypothetical protein [Salmonella enterica]
MTTYIYSGPPSGVTLNEGDRQREVLLWPGKPVVLAPDNPYTRFLLAMKYLQETDDSTPVAAPASSRRKKTAPVEVNDAR